METLTKDQIVELINTSGSLSEIMTKLNKPDRTYYFNKFKKRSKEVGIVKFVFGKSRRNTGNRNKSLEELMVKNSNYSRHALKKRLIDEKVIEYKCLKCGQLPLWDGKELVLQLDHINGDTKDNRKNNLRFLCPNCHSQTDTYAGKNARPNKTSVRNLKLTEEENKESRRGRRKIKNRPLKNTLLKDVKDLGYVGTGKKYNVSDNTIRKWLK